MHSQPQWVPQEEKLFKKSHGGLIHHSWHTPQKGAWENEVEWSKGTNLGPYVWRAKSPQDYVDLVMTMEKLACVEHR